MSHCTACKSHVHAAKLALRVLRGNLLNAPDDEGGTVVVGERVEEGEEEEEVVEEEETVVVLTGAVVFIAIVVAAVELEVALFVAVALRAVEGVRRAKKAKREESVTTRSGMWRNMVVVN